MMSWIIRTSLHLRIIVLAGAVLLVFVGFRIGERTAFDVFPEFAPPLVEIQTEAPGLSTEEVESFVTIPLENALNGAPWLKTIRSKSVLGLSSVVLIFQKDTDLLKARQMVQERLSVETSRLPAVAHAPVMLSPLSSTSRALKIGMSSKKLSQMDLTDLAKWTIRPRLMAVSGVANVAIWGQRDKQFQVVVNPARLRAHDLTVDAVIRAAGDAATISGGGYVESPNQRLAVRHLSAVQTPEDLAKTVVDFRNGVPIRLGDVAEVRLGFPIPIGDGIINDGPGLLLIVEKQPWGNTLDVTRKVEAALEALRPGLRDVEMDSTIFRPATFIERSIANLGNALLLGCILVVIVLVLFFFEWRAALISLITIPLSLIAAAIVLHYMGGTINTMVLAGLVIAVGVVVDDAIIDVENIARRLHLNRNSQTPRSVFQVVLDASLEVRTAVVLASFIVVLVFVPVFFLPGLSGSFFRPLAVSYVFAILASMVVALTLTPALALMLLPKTAKKGRSPISNGLQKIYHGFLPRIASHPTLAMILVIFCLVVTALATPFLGEEFLPNFKETDFLMHWVEKPGTSLEAMDRITIAASRELRSIPGVRNFGAHVGRAEVADEVVGVNFTELWISIEPSVDYNQTVAKIQEVVDGYPGLYRDVLTYLKERIKEVLTGSSGSIVVRIYGPDLAELRSKAGEAARVMESVAGVTQLKVEPQVLVPQLTVRLKTDAAARFGVTAGMVRRAAATLLQGTKVGEVFQDQKSFAVTVIGTDGLRQDIYALRELLIDTPTGAPVPLGDLADVFIQPAPNEIRHEGASRRIDVTCNVSGRSLGDVAKEIGGKVKAMSFNAGYYPEFLGEYAERQSAQRNLLLLSAFALLAILLLLHAEFRSFRLALLVFLTLPFALIGGVAAAFGSGGVLSLGSLVGFVTVLGIAARNGIMLISHYQHLQEREGAAFDLNLIVRGAEERLAPILMTALCAGLGLIPLIVAGNKPGHEIEYPMAIVILGGLVTSTALNLLVMPALFWKFGAETAAAIERKPHSPQNLDQC